MDSDERPPRRVTGRILSLGFPLPGVRVDNYNFVSAPAFFDYDAIVVNPLALSELIEGVLAGSVEAATFTGAAVVGERRSATDVALAEVLLRRRDETTRLLAHGGVVICFAYPPVAHDVPGAGRVGTYDWLADAPPLVAGEGSSAQIVDFQHPMAPFVLSQAANVAYRAHIDAPTSVRARVFAQSYGGAAIAAELPSPRGRVVMLPALRGVPAGDGRYAMSEALQAGIRRLLGTTAEGREPYWLPSHDIPGLAERTHATADARAAAEAADASLHDAESHEDELAQYHRLLWQEGVVGLEPVVMDALRLIGFQVYSQNADEVELRDGDVSAMLEIGASSEAVDMAAHYRLRQRIEAAIQRRGMAPRGLIFVNGFRLQAPAERGQQAADSLRLAAETMRYCVAPTTALFGAVVAHLRGDADAVTAFRSALVSTAGYIAAFDAR